MTGVDGVGVMSGNLSTRRNFVSGQANSTHGDSYYTV
jgi:hypothetical protein